LAQKVGTVERRKGGSADFVEEAVERQIGNLEKPLQRTFLDSNILLYAEDAKYEKKRDLALALILHHRRQRTGVVSVQVLQEFFVNATGKLKLSIEEARYKVEFHSRFHVVEPAASDVLAAIDLQRLHRVSFWDALILHSAREAGCRVLQTEDMQHGQVIDGVKIVNPFLELL
jgi:predicted nucleic acid-binding protein